MNRLPQGVLPSRAFTLIELLTVIAIIAILAGILLPAIGRVRESARVADGVQMMAQVNTAMTSFLTEYDRWPTILEEAENNMIIADKGAPPTTASTSTPPWTNLFHTLTVVYLDEPGPDFFALQGNRRRLRFLEVGDNRLIPDSSNPVSFVDPWGYEYNIAVDNDFTSRITLPAGAATETETTVRSDVALWSYRGRPENVGRYLRSWD